MSLLNSISEENRRIIVSGLLPRKSVDLKPYNDTLKTICDENDIEFIDNYDSFLLTSGEMPASFFQHDKLHLNVHGTRRLLSSINKVITVTKYTPRLYKPKPSQGSHMNRNNPRPPRNGYHMSSNFCHICSKPSHSTQDCWYNGRNTPRRGVNPW